MRIGLFLGFIFLFAGCAPVKNEQVIGFSMRLQPAGLPIGDISFNLTNKQSFEDGCEEIQEVEPSPKPEVVSELSVVKPKRIQNKKKDKDSVSLFSSIALAVGSIFGSAIGATRILNLFRKGAK